VFDTLFDTLGVGNGPRMAPNQVQFELSKRLPDGREPHSRGLTFPRAILGLRGYEVSFERDNESERNQQGLWARLTKRW
jgi:hypothetical protein